MSESRRTYTNNEFIQAVQESTSFRQVLIKVGLVPIGGNYRTAQSLVKALDLDTSHFLGQGANVGKKFPSRRTSLSELLVKNRPYPSYKLKKRLLSEKLLSKQCNQCKRKVWQNKPIPLELHHCNGDGADNRIENLQLLCPNCHALTDNYRGKNIGKKNGGKK